MDNKIILKFEDISMTYHTKDREILALDKLNLSIYDEEILGIVGPSGCGKSTLLSLAAGLIKPSKGKVLLRDREISQPMKNMAYMFQKDQLFDWRNILDNVILGLEIQKKLGEKELSEAREMLENYGLGDFINSYPNQLSGGMRQRVALIRTLLLKPEILLLDEPFSALDYQTRLAISDEIGLILREKKKTAILVTHDIAEAISLCDRVAIMSTRPGKIKEIININLSCNGNPSPIKLREAPEFKDYFNKIWKELDIHVK